MILSTGGGYYSREIASAVEARAPFGIETTSVVTPLALDAWGSHSHLIEIR